MEKVTVADGKYTICNDRGNLTALRNGEPWERDELRTSLAESMQISRDTQDRLTAAQKERAIRATGADWWLAELERLWCAPIGSPVTADQKRAAHIALKVAAGNVYNEITGEWVQR